MSRRVRVAMLDSGVHTGNPHIQRGLEGGVSILPDGVERSEFQDTLGHGTAVCAVLQELVDMLDLGMPPQAAVTAPRSVLMMT